MAISQFAMRARYKKTGKTDFF